GSAGLGSEAYNYHSEPDAFGKDSHINAICESSPNVTIFSEHSPTETTVAATNIKYSKGYAAEVMVVGRPLANKRFYILDNR
ncbi:hypothetical protein BGZ54_000742, partial [Gamsiella multidivaricata]